MKNDTKNTTPILYGIGFLFFQYFLGLSSMSILWKSLDREQIKTDERQIDKNNDNKYVNMSLSNNCKSWKYYLKQRSVILFFSL